jgi:hypothetical protein
MRNLVRYAWRPVPAALGVAAVFYLVLHPREVPAGEPSASAAVADVLTARGFACTADDVTWTIGASGLGGARSYGARAIVRATPPDEPHDLFLVEARLSPEGRVIDVGSAWNLTSTSGADESRPLVAGSTFAYTTSASQQVTGVHVVDLAGRPPFDAKDPEFADFTRTQRAQTAITNLQEMGQTQGVVHDAYELDPPAQVVTLTWKDDEKLAVRADDRDIVIDAHARAATTGDHFVRAALDERARPGNVVTWGVDRVRDISWFGGDRMQWVKAIAFTGLDWLREKFAKDATSKDIHDEIGDVNSGAAASSAPTFTDPETGWPPPDVPALIKPPLEGEGKWIALDKDPFVTQTPGAPAAFLTTFIRPNPKRLDLNVYVTLWDPRQIALHMEAGVAEPVSATGARGAGLIPRDPAVMKHVVAAFNGGFQAQHGEYGMEADGVVYLPPKPYAATVMEMRDGSTTFGNWPAPGADGTMSIPEDILSYRQNLTALVDDGKFNPWQRTWWGGTPPGWGDNIHSARSALCLTKAGFVGYFYSAIISPDDVAAAEIAVGCVYGIHLDMNPGHAGFEFYDVAPTSSWQPLGRALATNWEAEGKVPQMDGWNFRARRMIKGMGHMLFPRYIQREGRDFFYLTTRTILPGAPVASALDTPDDGEGQWRVKGLPQHGFPYALATTWVHPDAHRSDVKVRVLRVDPRTVRAPGTDGTTSETPVVITFPGPAPAPPPVTPTRTAQRSRSHRAPTAQAAQPTGPVRAAAGESTLWFAGGSFAIGKEAPGDGAMALLTGQVVGNNTSGLRGVRAAVGINDEEGMLTWVELPEGTPADAQSSAMLVALLQKLGCSTAMLVTSGARALPGGAMEIDGTPATNVPPTTARLVRGQAPGAHMSFEDTALVPYSVWQPLQAAKPKLAASH